MGDHCSATVTRKGEIVGFSESNGRGRAATFDVFEDGSISFSRGGITSQGEEGTLLVSDHLVRTLNSLGSDWGAPVLSAVQHVDCEAQNGAGKQQLWIQVVRAMTDRAF